MSEKHFVIKDRELTYEEVKKFLDNYKNSIQHPSQRYPQIIQFIPTERKVLDYGCGWGIFSEMIHNERRCTVEGIDRDPNSIEIAKTFIGEREGLTFIEKSIHDIADESFDVVVSTQVAEHTHNPGNYIKECNRILRKDGYLIISVPNILNFRHFLSMLTPNHNRRYQRLSAEIRESYDKTKHHIQAWDPRTFCRLLCSLGFEYDTHAFLEGVALPGRVYWRRFVPPLIRNWSFTMMFKMRKVVYVDIAPDD